MKNVKKLLAMALATILVSSTTLLTGCDGSSSSKDNVTVDIFQFKVEAKDALEKAAKRYEELNEGVKINIQTVGGGDDYGSALKAKFQSGEEPTIFNIGGPQDTKDWMEKLEDLTATDLAKNAADNTLGAVTSDGKVYGVPLTIEGYGLIYNKDIFKKAGIDPSTLTTFAKLEEAVKTLDSKKSELKIDSVFVMPAKENWVTGLHTSNVAFSNEFKDGTEAFNAKTIEFKYASQLKKLLDIQVKYGYKPDGSDKSVNGVDYATQVEKQFSLGKAAIIQQGNWIYSSVEGIDKDLASNIGILPINLDGIKEGCIPVGVPMYWAVNSTKKDAEKEAAKDFLSWLYTSDEGKKMIINDFKFIPAYKGYESDDLQPADPLAKDVAKFSQEGKTMPWVFMGYPTGFGEDQLGASFQKYFAGELTWDDVVKQAKDNWSAARK